MQMQLIQKMVRQSQMFAGLSRVTCRSRQFGLSQEIGLSRESHTFHQARQHTCQSQRRLNCRRAETTAPRWATITTASGRAQATITMASGRAQVRYCTLQHILTPLAGQHRTRLDVRAGGPTSAEGSQTMVFTCFCYFVPLSAFRKRQKLGSMLGHILACTSSRLHY